MLPSRNRLSLLRSHCSVCLMCCCRAILRCRRCSRGSGGNVILPLSIFSGDRLMLGGSSGWETMTNGSCYYLICYYYANVAKTIISPLALLATSNVFVQWQQIWYKDPTVPGSFRFMSHDGLALMHFSLQCWDGLYYCDTDIYTIDKSPVHVHCRRAVVNPLTKVPQPHRPASKFQPTLRARQVESEIWAL
jgi:hypothetical protein